MAKASEAEQPVEGPAESGQVQRTPSFESADEDMDQTESSKEARNMAMLCHLLGIVGFVAPLVIWLNEKDKHRFVDEHGRAAMNYQVSIMIYYLVFWLLCFVLIGVPLLVVLSLAHIVFVIIGAVRASRGKNWRYPIAIPFLK